MTPGTIFFDTGFKFHDGEHAEKLLITVGTGKGLTLVVKITSQGRHYRNDYGCQAEHRLPNFHLPRGSCFLSKPTWVCLHEFYEFNDRELLQRHFSGQVKRMGLLADQITIELLECALSSEDINERQSEVVLTALAALRNQPREG